MRERPFRNPRAGRKVGPEGHRMNRFWIGSFLCAGVLAFGPGPAVSQAEFEIRVGGAVYEAVPDRPLSVVTPKGERMEIVIRRKEILRFADHGVSFNYPRLMKVSSEKQSGVVTITAESAASPLVLVQVYPAPSTETEVRASLVENFRDQFKSRKAEFLEGSGGAVRRAIRGVARQGQALEFLLGGQRMRTEIYAFPKDGRVVALILQHDLEDADLAKKHFSIITDSLE